MSTRFSSSRDQRKNTLQPSTTASRNSANELLNRFHIENNLSIDSEGVAIMTACMFNDEKNIQQCKNWL